MVPIEWLADAVLRGVLLALLLVLAGLLMRDRPRWANRGLGVYMLLGLCVQVAVSTPVIDQRVHLTWLAPAIAVSAGNAVLFWLLVRALVDDAFVVRRRHAALWAGVVGFVWLRLTLVVGSGWTFGPWLMQLQRVVPPLFAILSAIAAGRHWSDDLVEGRRRLRGFIVLAGIGYSAFSVLEARSRFQHADTSGAIIDTLLLLGIFAVVAARLLRLGDWELLRSPAALPALLPALLPDAAAAPTRAPAEPSDAAEAATSPLAPPDAAEQRLAEALTQAMVTERAYRTEDLTVAGLAARLAVPEYRLRRLINQRLGHRNFNAFVNGYRLDAAREALADPARRDLPILTIALDAGFQSIGPFNRAFKTATGLTPGEFRREKLADS